MIKALFFDMDGTIAYTIPAILEGLNAAMRHYGYPEHDEPSLLTFINHGARSLIERAMPESERSDEQIDAVLAYYDNEYMKCYLHTDETYPGLDQVIRTLHDRGYRIAVITNKQHAMVQGLCDQLLPGLVELAIGQRDGYPTKPDPTVPLAMAAEMGLKPEEIALIGDSDVDMVTARNSGFMPVGVSWGYRPAEVLFGAGAEVVVDETADLLELFR